MASPSIIKPAPVCPPLGLPSYHLWGFLPCVPCLLDITLFGATLLDSLLAAHARWVLPCAGAVAPAQESPQPASAIPPPAPLAGCLFLGAGAVAPAPRNSQPPSSRPPPAGAPKLPFRWSQQNGFSKKKFPWKEKNLPWKEKKVYHGKKKIFHGKKKSLPWKEKAYFDMVKYQKRKLKTLHH